MWYFLKTEIPKEFNFDHSLKDFFERGIEGLVRENIQNSLDAKDTDKEGPVVVHIETGKLRMREIPGIDTLRDHIDSLPVRNEYAKETIENMESILKKYKGNEQTIPFISFEDSNTTGLNGIPTEDDLDVNGSWSSYAYYRGSHHQTDIEEKNLVSGGSHGIGKISSNAASSLHLMYFINRDENGSEHISGNISLIDHKLGDEKYTGSGIFTKYKTQENELKFYPEINQYEYPFSKETRGLKLIIPFLASKYNDHKKIVRAICDNFFVAILNGDLEVHLDTLQPIRRDSIVDFVKNERYYPCQDRQEMKDDHTPVYVDTYINHKLEDEFQVTDGYGKNYNFNIFYQVDQNIKSGRFAIVRKIGMTIENRKVAGYIRRGPFSGILIPKDSETDRYLKKLENTSHTKLEYKSISNEEEARAAKKFLKNLEEKIIQYAEASKKEEESEAEDVDTSDMIYSIENILGKNVQPIKNFVSTTDSFGSEKEVFPVAKEEEGNFAKEGGLTEEKSDEKAKTQGLVGANKKKIQTEKEKKEQEKKQKQERKAYRERKKQVKKVESINPEDEDSYARLAVVTSNIKRVQVKDRELILVLTGEDLDEKVEKAHIYFFRIDGDGEKEREEFDLRSNFKKIVDKNSEKALTYRKNKINNVSIIDGKILIEMTFKKNYNKDCKFNLNLEYKQ